MTKKLILKDKLPEKINPDKDDKLNRLKQVTWLSNLIKDLDNKDSYILGLESPRWSWKTFFLKMFKSELENEENNGIKVIYLNTFSLDYIDDPLLVLLGKINEELPKSEQQKQKFVKITKKLAPLWWKLLSRIFFWGIDITAIPDEIEKAIDKDLWDYTEKLLESYLHIENNIKELRQLLGKLKEEYSKVIFIVDELDRCKPDFALNLLEFIKHIFDISGYIFILSYDKEQLNELIKYRYGNINPEVYIQKFVDFEFSLSQFEKDEFGNADSYFEYVRSIIEELNWNLNPDNINLFAQTFNQLWFSLREIKKAFSYLSFLWNIDYWFEYPVMIFSFYLKLRKSYLLKLLVNKDSTIFKNKDYLQLIDKLNRIDYKMGFNDYVGLGDYINFFINRYFSKELEFSSNNETYNKIFTFIQEARRQYYHYDIEYFRERFKKYLQTLLYMVT